jgi:hypothetical protein
LGSAKTGTCDIDIADSSEHDTNCCRCIRSPIEDGTGIGMLALIMLGRVVAISPRFLLRSPLLPGRD